MRVPSAYGEAYACVRPSDPEGVDNYIRHTTIGDPELDPVLEELSDLSPAALHRYVRAIIEWEDDTLCNAPKVLRDFFDTLEEPTWLDWDGLEPGIRTFYKNADLMLGAFVTGVLVEGFSTLIAKSFYITGRVKHTNRRLRQNNRQLLDIFFPNGLYRNGEGWKLSVRVRFVHGRMRSLLAKSPEWDHEAWGTPLSAAHLGYAISVFSKRLLDYSTLLGARFSEEDRKGVMDVWRYSGFLMGVPESILYSSEEEAQRMHDLALLCEPAPGFESGELANALIQSIPSVARIDDEAEKKKIVKLAYRLSRALIGNELANGFGYPKQRPWHVGTLALFRTRQRLLRRWSGAETLRANNITQLLQISMYDEEGLSYRMPDHVKAEKQNPW